MQYTPDHNEFMELANLYAKKHRFMAEVRPSEALLKQRSEVIFSDKSPMSLGGIRGGQRGCGCRGGGDQ